MHSHAGKRKRKRERGMGERRVLSVRAMMVDTSSRGQFREPPPPPQPMYISRPNEAGSYPVVMFFPGTMCAPSFYSQLLDLISALGYIAVSPQVCKWIWTGQKEEIKNAAEVIEWLEGGLESNLPKGVKPDYSVGIVLSGHSRGGKTAFCVAMGVGMEKVLAKTSLRFSAVIGVDPVSGISIASRTEPHILSYVPRSLDLGGLPVAIIGSGLGSESKFGMMPACAPDGVNHTEFFVESQPPVCYFLATEYGHMDFLDDGVGKIATCMCKSGDKPRDLLRQTIAKIVGAFLKAFLSGQKDELLAIIKDPDHDVPINLHPVIYVPSD